MEEGLYASEDGGWWWCGGRVRMRSQGVVSGIDEGEGYEEGNKC